MKNVVVFLLIMGLIIGVGGIGLMGGVSERVTCGTVPSFDVGEEYTDTSILLDGRGGSGGGGMPG